MGRGRSSSGGGGGRGSSFSGGGSRGRSSSSARGHSSHFGGGHHTTIFVGGPSHYHGGGSGKAVLIVMAIVFMMFGIAMLGVSVNSFNAENDYGKVQAECIDNDYISGWYYTTYEYTVNGTEYVRRSVEGWEYPEVEGKIVTIYYLKDNPNHITEKAPNSGETGVAVLVAGLIFTGVGVALLVTGIKSKKAEEVSESSSTSSESSSSSSSTAEQYTRCAYCGSKYKSSLSSCPKCGAGK